MPDIILATLNIKYIHASLGLRCLLANLGELEGRAALREFLVGQRSADIVEGLLATEPRVIGFGVYIWNVEEITRIVALLKQLRPDIAIVIGGPEVSHEYEDQALFHLADYLITGPGDLAFPELCLRLLAGERPPDKVIAAAPPPLARVALPYRLYDDRDIRHRLTYVEASRGCPFRCEFCLSALDRTAWPFDLDAFLGAMSSLYERGARHFKFVDRTFNLDVDSGLRILGFFHERLDERLFLHFELIPDRLSERLRSVLPGFPPGSLQFEIGIQTFNPEVQALISRRQDNAAAEANLRWLRRHTHVHLHIDLIAGLPGEDIDSFGRGFDRLVALDPHEIQVGVLKRLRGAPIARHTASHDMRYNPHPPYNVIATDCLEFAAVQRLGRFARYWDLIGNSGRFAHTRPLLLGSAPFARFLALSDWIHATTGRTHEIALDRLFDLVHAGMTTVLGVADGEARAALALDFNASGTRALPRCLADASVRDIVSRHPARARPGPVRQRRHHRQ